MHNVTISGGKGCRTFCRRISWTYTRRSNTFKRCGWLSSKFHKRSRICY